MPKLLLCKFKEEQIFSLWEYLHLWTEWLGSEKAERSKKSGATSFSAQRECRATPGWPAKKYKWKPSAAQNVPTPKMLGQSKACCAPRAMHKWKTKPGGGSLEWHESSFFYETKACFFLVSSRIIRCFDLPMPWPAHPPTETSNNAGNRELLRNMNDPHIYMTWGSASRSGSVSRDSEKIAVWQISGVTSHKELTRECANFPALTSQVFMHWSESDPRDFVSWSGPFVSSFFSFSFVKLRRQLFIFCWVSFSFIPKLVIPIKMSLNREIKSCPFAFFLLHLFHFIYLYRIVEKNIVLIKLRSC